MLILAEYFIFSAARIVCYLGFYSKYYNAYPSNCEPRLCTHIIYDYAMINKVTNEIMPKDPSIDIDEGISLSKQVSKLFF